MLHGMDDSDDEDADVYASAAHGDLRKKAAEPSSSYRSAATKSSSSASNVISSSQSAPRAVALSDERLLRITRDTADAVFRWDDIRQPAAPSSGWRPATHESLRSFSVATRRDSRRFAVRAMGLVPCSVVELRRLLLADDSETHARQLRALFESEFRGGAVAYTAQVDGQSLAVKTATFEHRGWWRRRPVEWCYVDVALDRERAFEKLSTSLQPRDVFAGRHSRDHPRARVVKHVAVGFYVTEHAASPPSRHAAVCFYGKLVTPRQLGLPLPRMPHVASDGAVKARLVDMARRCERLSVLVRRRRLGVQVLADCARLSLSLGERAVRALRTAGTRCCSRSSAGSAATRCARTALPNTSASASCATTTCASTAVRVCGPCLARVDRAMYDSVEAPRAPTIAADAADAKSPSTLLATALRHALERVVSGTKKTALMRLIQRVLGDTTAPSDESLGGAVNDEAAALALLDDPLDVPVLALDECTLANDFGRAYPLASAVVTKETPAAQDDSEVLMAFPVPEDEAQRTAAIQATRVREIGASDELRLVCELTAQQFGFMLTMIAIADRDEAFVAACSVPMFEGSVVPRENAFCSHTIMSELPLLVPYPEADLRFHRIAAVQQHGTRFYCGFPSARGGRQRARVALLPRRQDARAFGVRVHSAQATRGHGVQATAAEHLARCGMISLKRESVNQLMNNVWDRNRGCILCSSEGQNQNH
ncbi:hypothetical protein PINS_up022086 [Pythium insidiosum]|nr:hypothetical protein PINS_up022086 [Pythium insidiosum]